MGYCVGSRGDGSALRTCLVTLEPGAFRVPLSPIPSTSCWASARMPPPSRGRVVGARGLRTPVALHPLTLSAKIAKRLDGVAPEALVHVMLEVRIERWTRGRDGWQVPGRCSPWPGAGQAARVRSGPEHSGDRTSAVGERPERAAGRNAGVQRRWGELLIVDDGRRVVCHLCGRALAWLGAAHLRAHGWTPVRDCCRFG